MLYCPNPDCLHLRRTGSPAEFREGIQHCSDCHTQLTQELPQLSGEENELTPDAVGFGMSVNWTLLTQVNNAHEANLIQALLESENILVSIGDEHMNRLVPAYSSLFGWIKIFVPAEDLARAQTLLAADHSTDVEQLSEAELTQAALASPGPEDFSDALDSRQPGGPPSTPIKVEGVSWLIWLVLALCLLWVLFFQ